jgi:replicative DNA helicase
MSGGHKQMSAKEKSSLLSERSSKLVPSSGEVNDAFEELSEEQEMYATGETRHFASPFIDVDRYTDGGMEKKRLYTIGAYSNVGKSKLAYFFVQHALKQGKKVMFFSLEVERRVVLRNVASAYLKYTQDEIRANGNCHMALPKDRLIIIDDKYEFRDIAESVKEHKPDMVVLDFVQNLRNGPGNEYEVMTRNAGNLQQLAKEADCCLVCLSQTNNDSRFKDGEQATLRGSGALFHSSDLILTLHRNEEDKIVMTIAKNKEGPAMKKFEMEVDFPRGQWKVVRELVKGVGGF